jgi:hypothetical protein
MSSTELVIKNLVSGTRVWTNRCQSMGVFLALKMDKVEPEILFRF